MAATTPRMATANAPGRQGRTGQRPMFPHRFQRILRTRRRKPAAAGRTKQKSLGRRQDQAIGANRKNQNVLERIHDSSFSKLARRRAARKSFSTEENGFPAIEFRATKTNSTGWARSCWCNRKLSRNNRRARLRTVAAPIFRLVTTPNLEALASGTQFQLAIRQPCTIRLPAKRMRTKSRLCASRIERASRKRFGGAAFTKSNRRQAFAAQATAISEDGLAALAGITGKKAVLTFTADLRRLILAFHKFKSKWFPAQKPERERIAINRFESSCG
jgi:hypothetical protein